MRADSDLAILATPGLGQRKGKYLSRTTPVLAVVVHTTGPGPNRRYLRPRERGRCGYISPFDAAVRIYRELMYAGPHYVVGQQGEIAQMTSEDLCAWHVGGRGGKRYDRVMWSTKKTAWWWRRWPDFDGPKDLAGGKLWQQYAGRRTWRIRRATRGGSVNANTIGVEVVPPLDDPRGPWSAASWQSVCRLVVDICDRHGIKVSREHVMTHSDCHPHARSARGEPWDTNTSQFTWEQFCERAGMPLVCG